MTTSAYQRNASHACAPSWFALPGFGGRVLAMLGTVILGALLGLVVMPTAQAAFNNATPRSSIAGTVNYVVTGGSLRTSGTNACAVTNSNTATLSGIPAGSTIRAAYLYWGGSGPNPDSNVTLNGNNLSADDTFTDIDVDDFEFFGGFKDVTGLVSGNGSFTFSDLTVTTTDTGGITYCSTALVQAGWALIVVYENASQPNRVINIYDGLQHFWGETITTTPTNFSVPAISNGQTTVVTWEGDTANSGGRNGFSERLTFNGTSLTDACNPTNNLYNSTIVGSCSTANYGVDIDTYNVSGSLSQGDTSATLVYSSGADQVYLAAQVISTTTTPVANLSINKSHSGNFIAGGSGSYSIVVHNNGPDTATGITTVTDTLPTGLSYGSFSGSGWSCGVSGQTVTCSNNAAIADGADLPTLTLAVNVAASAPASVDNTATVSNPTFDNIPGNNSDTDPTTIIGGPQPPASGNKILYLYNTPGQTLSRTPQPVSSTAVTISGNNDSEDWLLTPVIPAGKSLTLSAGTVTGQIVIAATGQFTGFDRDVTIQLRSDTALIGTTTIQVSGGVALRPFNLTVPQTTLAAGDRLRLRIINSIFNFEPARIAVYQRTTAQGRSTLNFDTPTVINVDSVAVYSAAYPATTTQPGYAAGDTVFVRAVISDPFGAYDVSGADITLTDPDGMVQVTATAMTPLPAAVTAASKTFQYSYILPAGAKAGTWIASVTGKEGTEGTVTHAGTAIFTVNGPPLTIVKLSTVYSDPINGTTNPKAIPGALVTYQIIVTSPPGTQADANSVIVTDPIPANTDLFVNDLPDQPGTAPVAFLPGSSTLTLNFNTLSDLTDDVDFSSDGGATWTHVPAPDANGVDAAVTDIRLHPKGTFAPGNITLRFRVRVE